MIEKSVKKLQKFFAQSYSIHFLLEFNTADRHNQHNDDQADNPIVQEQKKLHESEQKTHLDDTIQARKHGEKPFHGSALDGFIPFDSGNHIVLQETEDVLSDRSIKSSSLDKIRLDAGM